MNNALALIIEDDADLAAIFDEALRAAQFETEVIRAGDEAQRRLRVATPAVVVLDLHLPLVSGTELLKQIRSDERLSKARVIVATADSRLAEELHETADLVLVKPISFSQLRDLSARFKPKT